MDTNPKSPLPPDKESLLRELNARIRIKDIKSLYRLREEVSIKWYESTLILLLFVSTLGFLAFVLLLLLHEGSRANELLERAVLIWSIPLVLTFVLTIEIILNKVNSLRKLNELVAQLLEDIQKQMTVEHPESHETGSGESKTSDSN